LKIAVITDNCHDNYNLLLSLVYVKCCNTHTPVLWPFSGTTRVSRYQKGKTNLDFTEARDSEWQWHQLGHMQVCNSLQTDNHASTPPLGFLQAGCPSCHPTNSVKALKANTTILYNKFCNACMVSQCAECEAQGRHWSCKSLLHNIVFPKIFLLQDS